MSASFDYTLDAIKQPASRRRQALQFSTCQRRGSTIRSRPLDAPVFPTQAPRKHQLLTWRISLPALNWFAIHVIERNRRGDIARARSRRELGCALMRPVPREQSRGTHCAVMKQDGTREQSSPSKARGA
jgi:hypothetical protein